MCFFSFHLYLAEITLPCEGHLGVLICREVNELTPEDLDEFFSDESERYLFLAFRGDQCLSCNWQLYYPNLLTYHFEKENDVGSAPLRLCVR